jgi:trk system potassium uptake protein TrkH
MMAVKAFKRGDVDKIVLTRPAVEAGESLGFLPGDLKEKIDPYLMPLYDSLVNAFGTLGTGGFSVLDDSIAGYANPAAEWIISIFLLLSGVNYNIYFFLLIKKFGDIKKNEELKAYLAIVLASTAIITVNVWNSLKTVGGGALGKCIRDAFFQVTSIISTAGFTTVDLNALPHLSQTVILFLMFTGACAGSTAGGFKLSRLLIIIKSTRREIKKFFKPNSVKTISLDGNTLDEPTVKSSVSYLSVFILVLGLSFALLSFEGRDMTTTFTAALACFNNIGPGFGDAASTFADFSYYSKIILSLDMLFGRLEIVPMLVLFSKSTWSKG